VSLSHARYTGRASAQGVDNAIAKALKSRVFALVELNDPWPCGLAVGVVSRVRRAVGRKSLDGDFWQGTVGGQGKGGGQRSEESRDGEVLEQHLVRSERNSRCNEEVYDGVKSRELVSLLFIYFYCFVLRRYAGKY
jgi:hypothetical protein